MDIVDDDLTMYTDLNETQKYIIFPHYADNKLHNAVWTQDYLLVAYRVMAFIVLICLLMTGAFLDDEPFGLYFSDWWILWISVLYFALTVNYAISTGWKVIHVLYEVVVDIQIPCTLIAWFVLYPLGDVSIPVDLFKHAIPLIFIIFDISNSQIVFYRSHIAFPIVLCSLYGIINLSYTLAREAIYSIVTYEDPWTYLLLLAVGVLITAVHFAWIHAKRWKDRYIARHNPDSVVSWTEFNIN